MVKLDQKYERRTLRNVLAVLRAAPEGKVYDPNGHATDILWHRLPEPKPGRSNFSTVLKTYEEEGFVIGDRIKPGTDYQNPRRTYGWKVGNIPDQLRPLPILTPTSIVAGITVENDDASDPTESAEDRSGATLSAEASELADTLLLRVNAILSGEDQPYLLKEKDKEIDLQQDQIRKLQDELNGLYGRIDMFQRKCSNLEIMLEGEKLKREQAEINNQMLIDRANGKPLPNFYTLREHLNEKGMQALDQLMREIPHG